MSTKNGRNKHLKSNDAFKIDCCLRIFSRSEILILEKYGNLFWGLTNGKIKPSTKNQERIILIAKNKINPITEIENAWFKYLGRRKLEKEIPEKFKLNYKIEDNSFFTRDDYYKLHPDKKSKF